jgi:CHAT domain-containing protein
MRLGGVRLVVLSACRTLRAGGERSGGFAGLSGALLGAGAGGVVGGTEEVDDAAARVLMTAFHRAWRRTGDGPAALRHAQLELLRAADPALRSPAAWGTFRYAGS